jgi:hypothetical protein
MSNWIYTLGFANKFFLYFFLFLGKKKKESILIFSGYADHLGAKWVDPKLSPFINRVLTGSTRFHANYTLLNYNSLILC